MSDLAQLVLLFARLGLVAFGGGIGILPEMERAAVGSHGWVTHQQFVDAYALSQMTPGPGMLMVVLIGERAAGPLGALAAGLAMFLPTSALTWFVANRWSRLSGTRALTLLRSGLAPVALGLLSAGVYSLFRIAVHDVVTLGIAATALLAVARVRISPALVVAAGSVAGLVLLR